YRIDPRLRFLMAQKHESGGLLIVSHDGGDSFAEIGKGYGPAWIFDGDTAVVARMKTKEHPKPVLLRTTDGGKTFQPCGDFTARALPRWHDGKLYWLVEGALLSTTDKGEHWTKISDLKDGRFGPLFGKNGKHLFVLTGAGIVESSDAGKNWSKPIAPPRELKGISTLTWMEYDPKNEALYIMKMGSELYKMSRK
ncbi:MAG: WD40/YVTN/BNR-like repeat-containing protein, partial [Gemmataceae bacterium]